MTPLDCIKSTLSFNLRFLNLAYLYYNLPISVCLCVCSFFWPPSHGPISYLTTYLDSLWHSGPNKSITEVIRAQTKKFLHSYGYGSIAIWMSVCLSEWFYTLTKCLSVCPNYSIPYKSLSVCPNDSIPLLKVCLSVRIILYPIYLRCLSKLYIVSSLK